MQLSDISDHDKADIADGIEAELRGSKTGLLAMTLAFMRGRSQEAMNSLLTVDPTDFKAVATAQIHVLVYREYADHIAETFQTIDQELSDDLGDLGITDGERAILTASHASGRKQGFDD